MNKKILSVFLEKKHLIILWEKHKWSNNIGLLNGGKYMPNKTFDLNRIVKSPETSTKMGG